MKKVTFRSKRLTRLPKFWKLHRPKWLPSSVFTPCITINLAAGTGLQVCTDLPCALRGADQFLQDLCGNLGIKVGETSEDGLITIEEVTCLAGCHRAPMFQLQGDGDISYHENQTVDAALELIAELKKKAAEREGTKRMSEYILFRHRDIPDINQLDVYRKHGGFDAFEKAVTGMEPAAVINEVKPPACAAAAARDFPPV